VLPDGLTYIVVSDGKVERRVPFLYLLHLESLFKSKYLRPIIGNESDTEDDSDADEINSKFEALANDSRLVEDLKKLADSAEDEKDSTGLQGEIDQVKNIMVENVER
jgi:hypothetical protein